MYFLCVLFYCDFYYFPEQRINDIKKKQQQHLLWHPVEGIKSSTHYIFKENVNKYGAWHEGVSVSSLVSKYSPKQIIFILSCHSSTVLDQDATLKRKIKKCLFK